MRAVRLTLVLALILVGTLALNPIPQAVSAQGIPDDFYTLHRDLAYAALSARNTLDLYIPLGDGPYPLVVWIHGGGWEGGDKQRTTAVRLTLDGYAVASLNYRLTDEAAFPAQIYDVKAAIRWLRANAAQYDIDATHIGVWGGSAGGHLVGLLGTSGDVAALEDLGMGNSEQSSRVQAVVPWFGPSDLANMGTESAPGCRMRDMEQSGAPEVKLVGCTLSACPDQFAAASPITYVTPDDPPFFIQHGGRDCLVPPQQSERLHKALESAGVSSELTIFPNAEHGGPDFTSVGNLVSIKVFFDTYLRGQP